MKANEIVAKLKSESPALFANLDDKLATRVVRATLAEVRKQLASADEGKVNVPGLGRFKVKQVENEKDGQKKTAKRVIFKAAQPSEEKKEKRKAKKTAAASSKKEV